MKADGILTIIGGVITFFVGIIITFFGYGLSSIAEAFGARAGLFDIIGIWGMIGAIFCLILILLPIFKYQKGKKWTILGLVISVLSLLMGHGFFIGPLLAIIGSALAVKNSGKNKQ